jgi:hypothetical protein
MSYSIPSVLPTISLVYDSTYKNAICPDAMPHVYGYTNSLLTTDTITDGTNTWVKTYTYSGNNIATESGWVLQPLT